jgi:TolB-like protein/tetratricopeptide (TPR) repeat protein
VLSPGENSAGLATRLPAGTPPSAAPLRGAKAVPLTIAVLALFGAGYFALDRLVLSKRAPTLGATSLRGDSAATPVNEKSIAVLPFIDLSEKKDQEYFSDGLAEELLDLLAKTPGLHVIARTSSFSFKGKPDDIPTIGRKLNVANILEGSVRKSGNRLRVTTQLVGASNGEHIWSETYDRELKDVFAVQDEIAAAVVGQLKLKLTPATPSAARRTANVEAYNQYLLGQHSYNSENLDGWRRAVEAFHKAIALDPNYVAPYDGLALVEYQLAGHTGDAAGNQRAQDAAARAVELGPDDPNGYSARGYIRYAINWDWRGAQEDFEKAIALDPGDAQFQLRYGELLGTLGRLPEAIAATRKGIELDPLLAAGWESLAQYLTYTRDFTAAHQVSRRALEISPESTFALNALGWLQLSEGNARDAVATIRKIDEEVSRLYGTSMAEHTLKDPAQSQRALEQLIAKNSADSAYQIADVYAWRGEKDQAFAWLNRAYEQRDGGLTQVKFDPLLNSLRSDPRYTAFLRKMNLPE